MLLLEIGGWDGCRICCLNITYWPFIFFFFFACKLLCELFVEKQYKNTACDWSTSFLSYLAPKLRGHYITVVFSCFLIWTFRDVQLWQNMHCAKGTLYFGKSSFLEFQIQMLLMVFFGWWWWCLGVGFNLCRWQQYNLCPYHQLVIVCWCRKFPLLNFKPGQCSEQKSSLDHFSPTVF